MNEPQNPSPTVSVVIPVYNGTDTILRALQSVLSQSYTDFEVLIVDDCSTDDTVAKISTLNDPRIRIISHDTNRGASAARNTAIQQAKGRLVAFLDADDRWLDEKLDKQVSYMNGASPHMGACFCDFDMYRNEIDFRKPRPRIQWVDSFLDSCPVSPGSTMMVRREVYDTVGLYDEAYERLEDWDWLLRLLDHYEVRAIPEKLAATYIGSRPSAESVNRSTERMLEKHKDRVFKRRGKWGLKRFIASLLLENVVAEVNSGNYLRGAAYFVKALASSPVRAFEFSIKAANYFSNPR